MNRMCKNGIGMVALSLLAALGLLGCNGQEDYTIGGATLGVFGQGSNFNPTIGCSPRRIGALVDAGTVRNIRYACDDFYGYTGNTGLVRETSQNFFVCPLSAKSVTFLIGGKTDNIEIGTGYFRAASAVNETECTYDDETDTFTAGQYDADGVYLFSLSDLVSSPARIDAVTVSDSDETRKTRNASALLQALDGVPGDELISIDAPAHEILFTEPVYTLPTPFLTQTFSAFVDSGGAAQAYLDAVEAAGGTISASGLPAAEQDTVDALTSANLATSAGIYRYELLSLVHATLKYGTSGLFDDNVVVGDTLAQLVAINSFDPDLGDAAVVDPILAFNSTEFWPFVMISRRGQVTLGGAFDVLLFASQQEYTSQCEDRVPDYSTFSTPQSITAEGRFTDWPMTHRYAPGTMNSSGRLFGDYAFHGQQILATDPVSGEPVEKSDYLYIYSTLPETGYEFNQSTDRTSFTGTLCDISITDQPVNSLLKAGSVTPSLDQEVMNDFAGTPAAYTLQYWARTASTDEDPDQSIVAELPITIHSDGTILTDLYLSNGTLSPGVEGNTTYVPGGPLPTKEYEIGMVTSVFRSNELPPQDVQDAVMNVAVFNHAPLAAAATLPKYGSHFRARLIPKAPADCDNALSLPLDRFGFVDQDEDSIPDLAYWYDPYEALDVLHNFPPALPDASSDPLAQNRYDGLRLGAYGYIQAVRTDCP